MTPNANAGLVSPPAPRPACWPVAVHKFVVLSICTVAVYPVYWMYKSWQRLRERRGDAIHPFWRASLAPFWGFSLFRRIAEEAHRADVPVVWSPDLLGALFLALSCTWLLPGAWWLVGVASFIPLIPVVQTANEINERHPAPDDRNTRYSGLNIITIVVGGLILALAIAGSLMTPSIGVASPYDIRVSASAA